MVEARRPSEGSRDTAVEEQEPESERSAASCNNRSRSGEDSVVVSAKALFSSNYFEAEPETL